MPESTLETPDYIFGFKPKKDWGSKEPESVTITGKKSGQSKQFFGTSSQVKRYTRAVQTFQLSPQTKPEISTKIVAKRSSVKPVEQSTKRLMTEFAKQKFPYTTQEELVDYVDRLYTDKSLRFYSGFDVWLNDKYGKKSQPKQISTQKPVPSFVSLAPQKPIVKQSKIQMIVKKQPVSDPFGFNKILGTSAPKPKTYNKKNKETIKTQKSKGKCIVKVRDYFRFI